MLKINLPEEIMAKINSGFIKTVDMITFLINGGYAATNKPIYQTALNDLIFTDSTGYKYSPSAAMIDTVEKTINII